jgi:hypothetical protein
MLNKHFWLYVSVSLLIISGTLATIPVARAQTPTIFIDPNEVVGDLTPAAGTSAAWKINVTDIGPSGLIGYEFNLALDPQAFPDYKPAINGNFTSDASGWTAAIASGTTGTPTYGYDATEGNPALGSGPGSYLMRVNSSAGGTGNRAITLDSPTFQWTVGAPMEARLSFAYTVSGNSFGSASVGISVVKPGGATQTLITTKTFTSSKPWSYNFTATSGPAFSLKGTYQIRLRSSLITAAAGVNNYVQVKWDDIGLQLAPISVSEGPFLASDPRNAGKTLWNAKYMRYPTNNSLYVSENLNGEPYTAVWPVQGGGMIANITVRVDYGAADLDLWGTILLEPGLVPPYTPTPIDHIAVDGWFDNRILGDANADKTVNVFDILAVKSRWGRTPASPDWIRGYDVNNDQAINVFDILTVKANWGRTTP